MNNKHLSWYKEINNNFIIASRAYFLQSPTCTRVNNLDYTVMILTPMEPWCWSCFARGRGLVNGRAPCLVGIFPSPPRARPLPRGPLEAPPTYFFILYISTHVMPRDRCARSPLVFRRRCHVICLRVASYHVIMPSSHKSFATQLNKLHGSSVHLNRGNSHGDSLYNISSQY